MLKKPFVLDTWQSMERPRIGPSVCVQKGEWTQGWRLLGSLHYVNVYKNPKSLCCEDKKRRRKGGRKMSTVFFFFPFPSSACYNGFRMHARSMISPILFLLLFSKRKSRRKCPLMLMARSPPRSHHRFTTTFLSGSVYRNPGVCPFGWTINCLQTVLGGGAVLNV
jgi:hypothetical protein